MSAWFLTLVADPARFPLAPALVARMRDALAAGPPDWLAAEEAADLPLAEAPDPARVRAALESAPVDALAVPAAGRRKRLLVADMDSTMVTGETLDDLADYAGLKEHIAAITARAMNGEIDFKDALRERVGLLAGLSAAHLEATFQRIAFMPGARTLVQTMKAHGARAVLVSGGFKYFTSRVAAHCGFDRDLANELEIAEDRLTGRVIDPILDRATKLETLIGEAAALGLPLAQTLAVGDGANDLDMLRAAGLGVAYHAKPVVAAEARARIDHGDLTALLFAQGYTAGQFAG